MWLGLRTKPPAWTEGLLRIEEETFGPLCVSFLRVHTDEDPDHIEKAFAMLDGTTDVQRELIKENLRQTVFAYGAMLREIRGLAG